MKLELLNKKLHQRLNPEETKVTGWRRKFQNKEIYNAWWQTWREETTCEIRV